MTVDLKIAEALGIPIDQLENANDYASLVLSLSSEPRPHIVVGPGLKECEYCGYLNGKFYKFRWSLTGPDAGNTREVVENLLKDRGYNIRYLLDKPHNIVTIKKDFSNPPIAEAGHRNANIALREAAAKALKVEV